MILFESMDYHHLEPVIGLEIHLQLKTRTKLFCGCDNHADNAKPNALICPICTGQPGTLPSLNRQALLFATHLGDALGCKINSPIFFDRKHYIYPDLPKGYQISQFDVPVAENGELVFEIPGGERTTARIHIERAHLEEDAAKNTHQDGKTLVDFNRAGTPLVETVTGPDFRSPEECKLFLQELRRIARYLGVSDADMEKGHMRVDANVSLRPVDASGTPTEPGLFPKTEVKNMNSFRSVERALVYEIERQTKLWESGTPPMITTTRGWDDDKRITVEQRTKEAAADYRYMREPDIPPTDMHDVIRTVAGSQPELPQARRTRFTQQFGLSEQATWTLTDDVALADFTEAVVSEFHAWLGALPEIDQNTTDIPTAYKEDTAKLITTWIATKLLGAMNERSTDIRVAHITPENMAELLKLVHQGTVNPSSGTQILEAMLEENKSPTQIMKDRGLESISGADQLGPIIDQVFADNPEQLLAYKEGKHALFGFFMGQVQKMTQGSADPIKTKELLTERLNMDT